MYSTITGTISKSAADVQANCQGAGGGAVKEVAETVVEAGAEAEEETAAAGGQTGGGQTPAGGMCPGTSRVPVCAVHVPVVYLLYGSEKVSERASERGVCVRARACLIVCFVFVC